MTAPPKTTRKKRHVGRPDISAKLLDAAEAVIREEGYAAATVRRIAKKAGLNHQAVFYYFGSQEDLLLAVYRRAANARQERLTIALNSDQPLSTMWEVLRDPHTTGLGLEFMALANHSDTIRVEMAGWAEACRALEVEAVRRYLAERGIEPRISPQMVSILTNALARLLVQDAALGIDIGHEEAEALVDASFRNFEARGEASTEVEPGVGALSTSD